MRAHVILIIVVVIVIFIVVWCWLINSHVTAGLARNIKTMKRQRGTRNPDNRYHNPFNSGYTLLFIQLSNHEAFMCGHAIPSMYQTRSFEKEQK